MPHHPARPCNHPGCPHLVRGADVRYCPEHLAEHLQAQDARRGTAAERGYDKEWQQIRAQFLYHHPTCAQCGERATVAHHIIRKRDTNDDSEENLLALCHSCHSRLHAKSRESWSTSSLGSSGGKGH